MRSARVAAVAGPLLAILVAAAARCTGAPPAVTDLPECPHSWDGAFGTDSSRKRDTGQYMRTWRTSGSPRAFLISRAITDIPEFNDCQRVMGDKDGSRRYLELGAIFARFNLDSVVDSLSPISHSASEPGAVHAGALVRPVAALPTLSRDGTSDATTPPAAVADTAATGSGGGMGAAAPLRRALAEIVSEGVDDLLGIQVGFNCLVAEYTGTSIRAAVHAMGTDHTVFDCVQLERPNPPPAMRVTRLGVVVQDFPSVPPAARWEWDGRANRQLFGTKCGARQWCTFGPEGASISTANAVGSATGAASAMSPGWYDQQYLADVVVTSTGGGSTAPELVPSGAFSTVIPAAGLAAFQRDSSDWVERWVEAAYIAMPEPFPLYTSKLGLRRTAVPVELGNFSALNRLEVCYGTMKRCGVLLERIDDPQRSACSKPLLDSLRTPDARATLRRFWTRIIPPGASSSDAQVRYHCTTFRHHPGVEIPPMVRWRWKVDDETVWVYCPEGCCEVHSSPLM